MKINYGNKIQKNSLFICVMGLFFSAQAWAEDSEGSWLGGDEEETKEEKPSEGGDTPDMYREAVKEYKLSEPEDEILLWQEYLSTYPNTTFKKQIETRILDLEGKLYEGVEKEQMEAQNEGEKELYFSQPQLLENIDPRKKLRFAFEMGLPDYINLLADYEHPLRRDLSVHGGLRKRYSGWSIEGGGKYALVKSVRTQSLVTVLGDIRINTIPFFVGLRPQISAGKIMALPNNFRLDVMGQIGTELQVYGGLQALLIGGFHVSFIASETVRVYVEGNMYMKDFVNDRQGMPFAFNTITFGMKFRKKAETDQYGRPIDNKFEGAIGTTVPVQHAYWLYHFGSITGDVNIY